MEDFLETNLSFEWLIFCNLLILIQTLIFHNLNWSKTLYLTQIETSYSVKSYQVIHWFWYHSILVKSYWNKTVLWRFSFQFKVSFFTTKQVSTYWHNPFDSFEFIVILFTVGLFLMRFQSLFLELWFFVDAIAPNKLSFNSPRFYEHWWPIIFPLKSYFFVILVVKITS